MRITGGLARGIPLKCPTGREVRPATDRMREAVFSHLGGKVTGARVLDLYAGTGAYGLEALSRGACSLVSVENDRRAADLLKSNLASVLKSMGAAGNEVTTELLVADALRKPLPGAACFDLIFADPPYNRLSVDGFTLLHHMASLAAPEALLLLEKPGAFPPPTLTAWTCAATIGKGREQPSIAVYRRTPAENSPL